MHIPSLLPLALLSTAATGILAHAAPPNPHQLYALQSSAESEAAPTHAHASHGHGHRGVRERRSQHEQLAKRHQVVQAKHAAPGARAMRMERRTPGGAMGGRKEDLREKRGVIDSSATPDDPESDLEARAAEQYAFDGGSGKSDDAASSKSSGTASAKAASSSSSDNDVASSASKSSSSDVSGVWKGVSSYYIHTLPDSDRHAVLDAIAGGGFKVVRIFIASVSSGNKGSANKACNDVEPQTVGEYDDSVLEMIDQLMVDCKQRGLKLLIALSDRYSLGFWATDSYAVQLNIVPKGSSGAQKVANAASFYTNAWSIQMFEKRLAHIMSHKNSLMGNQPWSELDSVIYAVEPQNEPQGHMAMASSTWACDRAKYLKGLITSNIKVSTGGGITTTDSLGGWATGCPAFDVISVHDYGTSASTTANALAAAKANNPGKEVIMGEWGAAGVNKAAIISQFVAAFKEKGVSWMHWQITNPGAKEKDFEVWTDEPAWKALTGQESYQPVAVTSKAASPAATSKAAAPAVSSASKQWSQATSSFASHASKASSYVQEGASKAASVVKSAADKATSAAGQAATAAASAKAADPYGTLAGQSSGGSDKEKDE
ncbi:uncharacterized protein JCM10292_000758 [Rhodotorula paludigena]|uniref:uncharacterized protein n=1 Tax=Rhodotorula paludigena TaxID=86838 RepID=UPI00317902FF